MPSLRRRRKRASGRVSGTALQRVRSRSGRPARAARPCAASRARRRGARGRPRRRPRSAAWQPRCGRPARPSSARRARSRSTSTGHAETISSSRSASERPLSRDVAAGVVADVERRAAEVLRQARAVAGRPAQPPGVLGLHQPVQEHDEPRRRAREGGRERVAPAASTTSPPDAQRHRRLQVGALALERVADRGLR